MSQRGKGKGLPLPNDFIALGSKSGCGGGSSGGSVGVGTGVKREGAPAGGVVGSSAPSGGAKKAKLPPSTPRLEEWESLALELDENSLDKFVELVSHSDKSINYLCGAVKLLRNQRAKPDQVLYLSLLYLAKSGLPIFHSDAVTRAFSSLLKRDAKENYKSKGNPLVPLLAANVLMAAYASEKQWPEVFVRVYIEDALGERVWVDHPDCKSFVDNVLTAFNTKPRDRNCPSPPIGGSASGSGSATPTRTDEDSLQSMETFTALEDYGTEVVKRYERSQELIEQIVMEVVREQLNRRSQGENVTKNFLKFLTNACGLIEVRLAVMPKIEVWMMNIHQKISRPAQELLLSVAINCNTHSAKDVEVIGHFSKLRFKSKQNVNLFLASVRELCGAHHENLPTLVKHTLFNELSNCRNINNMSMLSVMFSVDGDRAAASLATVFTELLLQKECYLRALRFLLREIVRVLKNDINLHYFCHYLMNECPKEALIKDFEFKDRMFKSITDLVTVAMFLGISPHVREYLKGEKKDYIPYRNYLTQVAKIQHEALIWLHERVPKVFKPEGQGAQASYSQCLHKILFMLNLVSPEEYIRIDGWPADNDRILYFKAVGEVPITQESLILLFYIGISKSLPINGLDTIHLAEELIKRAAGLQPLKSEDFPVLYIDRPEEIIRCLFQLATYNYPDSITLPQDYKPPILAISTAYWKAWMILVLLAAHNPGEFGKLALESYPTLRAFMEMTITNQFTFPPPTIAVGEVAEELKSKEFQIHQLERHSILELENHLAKPNVISESNSLLLPQLITMDPHGDLRKPPEQVLDQLKKLNSLHKIGHLLCRSRKPDFLLDILQRQGSNQAMPWLADLVESSEGSFNVLPVQCLCEFLLNSSSSFIEAENCKVSETEAAMTKRRKQKRLLLHLQNLLQNPNSDLGTCLETLDYFLRRLSSPQTSARIQALTGLRLVLTPIVGKQVTDGEDVLMEEEEEDESPFLLESGNDWLLKRLPELPTFRKFYPHITQQLRNACQVENDPDTVSLYIQFLAKYAPTESLEALADLCLDMATFIVERSTLFPSLLPGSACKSKNSSDTFHALLRLFTGYMLRIVSQGNKDQGPQWSDNQQELFAVYWPNGVTATLSSFIIHAQIILLTYGPSELPEFQQMVRIWHNPELPRAFNVQLSEETVLIPDWLKLKMIRSNIDCLVDSALKDLNPGQLVLFIQSFGIPVRSMTKLLKALDEAVTIDVEAVNESVMDKTYMGQLVAVQHQRGASGGEKFARALDLSYIRDDSSSNTWKQNCDAPNESGTAPTLLPRSTALIPPNQIKNTLLQIFDVGNNPGRLSPKEKQDTFRTLQKFISCEIKSMSESMPIMDATIKALQSILKSDSLRDPFISSLNRRIPFACSLFRLLTTSDSQTSNTSKNILLKVAHTLLQKQDKKKGSILRLPLLQILEGYVSRSGHDVKEEEDSLMDIEDEPYEVLRISSRINFEDSVCKLMRVALCNKEKIPELANAMAKLVLGKNTTEEDVKETSDLDSKIGLLTDWLSILSPELAKSSPELYRVLLFSKEYSVPSRPYLASTIVHQSSWVEIQNTMESVLERFRIELDPSAVLDFIEAIILNPRLRKGRDKHVPKHKLPEDILCLNESQIVVVIQYVLFEFMSEKKKGKNFNHPRMDFLLKILLYEEQIRVVIQYLSSKVRHRNRLIREDEEDELSDEEAVKELILEIYLKIPNCIFSLKYAGSDLFPSSTPSEGHTSPMDSVSHALLSSLASTQHGRSWAFQMQIFDLALRKLASSHPLLMLRNLSLLTSALKGRTSFEFSVFKSRNHMTLYSMSLGLIELLRPYVFQKEHRVSLHHGLQCYFEMIEAYFNRRESMFGLIDRFLSFMRDYTLHSPTVAVPFLIKYGKKLPDLADKMPNLASLKFLVSGIEWQEGCSSATSLNPKVVHRYKANLSCTPVEVKRLSSKFASLSNHLEDEEDSIRTLASCDSIQSALSELSSLTSSKPELLYNHFLREILFYMRHPIKSLRSSSHSLYVSLLKHKPSRSVELIDAYIQCLESSDPGVVVSALERLSDVAVLAQESLRDILQIVFSLGHHSNINISPYLNKTISVINSHSGY